MWGFNLYPKGLWGQNLVVGPEDLALVESSFDKNLIKNLSNGPTPQSWG